MIKRWTMMLIPHDHGETRSYNVTSIHMGSIILFVVGLCFVSGFLFQRNRIAHSEIALFESRYDVMRERALAADAAFVDEEEREALTAAIRAQFEKRDEAITSELGRLYDLEAEVRLITGLPPKDVLQAPLIDRRGGKGGGESEFDAMPDYTDDVLMRPPELIYGLAHPSADLIVQEINLRAESLQQLLGAMEDQRVQIAHTPSILPTQETERWISSRFGYRKDPFHKRVRHHDGLDVSAKYGSPVVATAEGVVRFSGHERFLGHVVKIDHENGIETWYAHLSKRLVETGEAVQRGHVIGKLGDSGRSTGPHIHYEVQVDGKPVDPRKYIGH